MAGGLNIKTLYRLISLNTNTIDKPEEFIGKEEHKTGVHSLKSLFPYGWPNTSMLQNMLSVSKDFLF